MWGMNPYAVPLLPDLDAEQRRANFNNVITRVADKENVLWAKITTPYDCCVQLSVCDEDLDNVSEEHTDVLRNLLVMFAAGAHTHKHNLSDINHPRGFPRTTFTVMVGGALVRVRVEPVWRDANELPS